MLATASREQKAQIVAECTDTLVRVLSKNPDRTAVVIQKIADENWSSAGVLIADQKAQAQG